jgi:hypothetical protein
MRDETKRKYIFHFEVKKEEKRQQHPNFVTPPNPYNYLMKIIRSKITDKKN